MLGRPYLVVLYTVVLGQDDLHFVAFLLDSSPQGSDYIPHASHLDRQHKPCLPFNNNPWKGNTSHVCLSATTPGKATQAMCAFQQQHLERQHKPCLPFNMNTWKGTTSCVCLSSTEGRQRCSERWHETACACHTKTSTHVNQLCLHMDSACHCF